MKSTVPLCLLVAVVLTACAGPRDSAPLQPSSAQHSDQTDGHNARNALDWAGTYEGTLPCADCSGIHTRLVLMQDGTYELQTRYLDRQSHPTAVSGTFTWQPDGSTILLDMSGDEQRYFVSEGRLIMLYQDGTRPTGPLAQHYELKQVSEQK
ncbi:copper resistance protein NlpE [Bordetella tumulicola]|uniref:copper resistance protein NlpE n=1 Tax=Bordetella tumulicola TaxID=1649133 RepID=UPI0039F0BD45